MPPGYSCKSSRCMWLVSHLSTEEHTPLPGPGLFPVSHPLRTVSNNTQSEERDPSAAELSCADSLETYRSQSPEFSPPAEQNHHTFVFFLGALGFPVLMPVPAPPSNPFQTRSVETAKPAPNIPTSFWSFQPGSLTFDRNIKL